ncbi:MAG: hypothetical protein IJ313_11150 [Clostridia bacterium]|nr:hypothetical protein [Clostridia bacterium]
MMKRWIAAICILCALLCGAACAEEYSPGYLMQPPREVLDHIARSFPSYTLEDYCEVYDTPNGDYGFAMLTAGDERVLLGYEEKDGKMSYWLKNHGAVMQGEEEAWFDSRAKGTTVYDENHEIKQADGLSFSITQLDSAGETYNEYIAYHWEDGGFKLTGYKDWDGFYGEVAVDDGVLHFRNWLEGWDFGKVYGTVQRDLRYVNFANLPKSIEEAREASHPLRKWSLAIFIHRQSGLLAGKSTLFIPGRAKTMPAAEMARAPSARTIGLRCSASMETGS